ncbi:hypothetical protein [Effusibacillus consociatus]
MQDFLSRFYELDQLKKMVDRELEKMKRILLESFPEPVEQQFGRYQLKIYQQDRGSFDLQKIFPLLPNEELRLFVSNPNNANIKELAKKGVLQETQLDGTYISKPVSIVSVKEIE